MNRPPPDAAGRGPRIDQLPVPQQREPGEARRGPEGSIAVYDLGFPARPWRVVYSRDPGRTGMWLTEADVEHWKLLVESDASAATLHRVLTEHGQKLRAERQENGRLSAALGANRAELTRVRRRLLALLREHAQSAAPAPEPTPAQLRAGIGVGRPVFGPDPVAPASWTPLAPGETWPPAPAASGAPLPGRFADGCRNVEGTWIHGRPHTCPSWMHS